MGEELSADDELEDKVESDIVLECGKKVHYKRVLQKG
jgi:hypothetical protein